MCICVICMHSGVDSEHLKALPARFNDATTFANVLLDACALRDAFGDSPDTERFRRARLPSGGRHNGLRKTSTWSTGSL